VAVITDVIMPDQEGFATIMELRGVDPSVKIIAVSGGGVGKAGDYLETAQMLGAMRTVAKPFAPETLLATLAEVLADADHARSHDNGNERLRRGQ
jgi:DNA-binding response OmpR family regulator